MKEILPKLTNKVVDILDESFSNLKDWLASFDERLSLPTSPTFQILNGIKWVYNQLLYFIEDVASEQNILTAERPESIYGIASLNGHEATRALSSSGKIVIQSKIPNEQNGQYLKIFNYSEFTNNENGLNYTLWLNSDYVSIDLYSTAKIELFAYQGKLIKKSSTFLDRELFTISIESNKPISMEPVKIFVNGELWSKYEDLYDMNSNSKGFLLKNNYLGGFNLTFGNGKFGKMPSSGSLIEIYYLETDGADGNFYFNSNFEPIGTGTTNTNQILQLNDYLTCYSKGFNFGSDVESIELTKKLSTKSSSSSLLSLSKNYEHYFGRFSSIVNTIVTEKKDQSLVEVILFPNFKNKIVKNNDYFNLKEEDFIPNNSFIDEFYNKIQNSGLIIMTGKLQILKPQIEKFALIFYIKPVLNFDKSFIKTNLIDKVTEYIINRTNQSKIQRSDLIAIGESINGIDSVTVMIAKENVNIQPNGFGDIELDSNIISWITGGFYDSNGVFYRNMIPDGNITGPITIFFVE